MPVVHGVGPPSGFTSDLLRLCFSVYSDQELEQLGVFSYGRASPTVENQLMKLREGHLDEPILKSLPFGEWWSIAGDVAFEALTGSILKPLQFDTLTAVMRPKLEGGIVQSSGCGAYPNYFAKAAECFGPNPKKSDSAVVAWCTETALSVIRNFDNSGRLDFRDRRLWTRTLTRLAISQEPKVRMVFDVSYPINALAAMTHLPLIRQISSCANCSFLGCDMLLCHAEFLSDFGMGGGDKVFTSDIRAMDLNVNFKLSDEFNERLVKVFDINTSPFGDRTSTFLSAVNHAPIVYPDGSIQRYQYQHVQSGLIGIQPLESWLNLSVIIGGDLLYAKGQEERLLEIRKAKVLADDGVTCGCWHDTKLLTTCRQQAAQRLGLEIPLSKTNWGDLTSCKALGYGVSAHAASLPEGQLLAGLLWPERSYPITKGQLEDNVERRELIATRAHGYQLTARGHYEKFSQYFVSL